MVTYQQNGLLEKQNALLREQNELLEQVISTQDYNGQNIYIKNIEQDEIRDGFLVTSHRKKLWNVQLNLIKELDRICKKHDIRWFAFYGTLLGAARHGGFIPWDDDSDVAMLRPDFEKFKKVAEFEIKPPYHLDIWYNYRLEIDEPSELTDDSLPLLSRNHHKHTKFWSPFYPIIKIRDKRTLYVVHPNNTTFIQGIWLDIFPLDSLPPFAEKQQQLDFEYIRVLFIAAVHPEMIEDELQMNRHFIIDNDTLRKFMRLPYKRRCLQVEEFLAERFFMSEHIGNIRSWFFSGRKFSQSKDFRDVIYLPFEKIKVPVPIGYESILTDFYGNWRKPSNQNHIHAKMYSADISWEEYLKNKALKRGGGL